MNAGSQVDSSKDSSLDSSGINKNENNKLFSECFNVLRRIVFKEQVKLVNLAQEYGVNSHKVQRKINALVRSRLFREYSVVKVASNPGCITPGVDKFLFLTRIHIVYMVQILAFWLKKGGLFYNPLPVKRVFIKKAGSGKINPLGIPTIGDRCIQELLNLVLEPLVEINSDPNSYGYRYLRSAKIAIGALRAELKTSPDQYQK